MMAVQDSEVDAAFERSVELQRQTRARRADLDWYGDEISKANHELELDRMIHNQRLAKLGQDCLARKADLDKAQARLRELTDLIPGGRVAEIEAV